jgi:hypothetical protein
MRQLTVKELQEAEDKLSASRKFDDLGAAIARLLNAKNKLYGDSALNPLNIFNGKTKVGQRIDDKLGRVKNSVSLRKNDVADLIGYLFLVCKENNWENFDDLID